MRTLVPTQNILHSAVITAIAITALLTWVGCGGSGGGGLFGGEGEMPYADVSNALGTTEAMPLRGRVVWVDEAVDITQATPWRELSQDELTGSAVSLTLIASDGSRVELGTVSTDDEGYLDTSLPLTGVSPGVFTLEINHGAQLAGTARVRLLAADHSDVVVRSDVDMTYLQTDFMSNSGLLGLMRQDARERDALPGMETLY